MSGFVNTHGVRNAGSHYLCHREVSVVGPCPVKHNWGSRMGLRHLQDTLVYEIPGWIIDVMRKRHHHYRLVFLLLKITPKNDDRLIAKITTHFSEFKG